MQIQSAKNLTKLLILKQKNMEKNGIFGIVKMHDYFVIVFRDSIISTKHFKNENEALTYLKSKPYEIIFNLICYMLIHADELLNDKNNNAESGK